MVVAAAAPRGGDALQHPTAIVPEGAAVVQGILGGSMCVRPTSITLERAAPHRRSWSLVGMTWLRYPNARYSAPRPRSIRRNGQVRAVAPPDTVSSSFKSVTHVSLFERPCRGRFALFEHIIYMIDVRLRRNVDGQEGRVPRFEGTALPCQEPPEAFKYIVAALCQNSISRVSTRTNHRYKGQSVGIIFCLDHVAITHAKRIKWNIAHPVSVRSDGLRPQRLGHRSMPARRIQTKYDFHEGRLHLRRST